MGTLGRHEAILLTTSKRGMSVAYTRAASVAISFAKLPKKCEQLSLLKYCNLIGLQIFCSVEQNWVAIGLTPDLSFFIEVGPLSIHMHEQHHRDGKIQFGL